MCNKNELWEIFSNNNYKYIQNVLVDKLVGHITQGGSGFTPTMLPY